MFQALANEYHFFLLFTHTVNIETHRCLVVVITILLRGHCAGFLLSEFDD